MESLEIRNSKMESIDILESKKESESLEIIESN
jgi:hypothetical protein